MWVELTTYLTNVLHLLSVGILSRVSMVHLMCDYKINKEELRNKCG